jgi:hypothetical protein
MSNLKGTFSWTCIAQINFSTDGYLPINILSMAGNLENIFEATSPPPLII